MRVVDRDGADILAHPGPHPEHCAWLDEHLVTLSTEGLAARLTVYAVPDGGALFTADLGLHESSAMVPLGPRRLDVWVGARHAARPGHAQFVGRSLTLARDGSLGVDALTAPESVCIPALHPDGHRLARLTREAGLTLHLDGAPYETRVPIADARPENAVYTLAWSDPDTLIVCETLEDLSADALTLWRVSLARGTVTRDHAFEGPPGLLVAHQFSPGNGHLVTLHEALDTGAYLLQLTDLSGESRPRIWSPDTSGSGCALGWLDSARLFTLAAWDDGHSDTASLSRFGLDGGPPTTVNLALPAVGAEPRVVACAAHRLVLAFDTPIAQLGLTPPLDALG